MTVPTPKRLFWRVMRGEYVHSAWETEREARLHASYLNSMIYDDEYIVEAAE